MSAYEDVQNECEHCWHERDHQSTEYLVFYWVCCQCDEATRQDPSKAVPR